MTEATWNSLASTESGGEGWTEANPAANHISELNLDNFTAFENPTAISLGAIIAPGSDTRDLLFEYFTVEGEVRNGTVQYAYNNSVPAPRLSAGGGGGGGGN